MTILRDLAALCAAGLVVVSAPVPASAQAEPDQDVTPYAAGLTAQAEQRALAQLGLGQPFMWRLLQTQLNILNEENKHDHGAGPCKALGDGGSLKLLKKTGTFSTKVSIEIYYETGCKKGDVFIHSEMTINQETAKSVSVTEKATYYDEQGKVAGTLTLKAGGAKKSSLVSFSGSGTWAPSKGIKVEVALSCSYPENLKGAKPFNCDFGLAQSFKNLKLDLATTGQFKVVVVPLPHAVYNGAVTGKANIYSGALSKLGVGLKGNSVTVSGASKPVSTATIKGTSRLTVFWPLPGSWTVTDSKQTFAIAMAPGKARDSTGTITNTTPPTPATFTIDESGDGRITYTDAKKSNVVNWLVSE